MLLIDKLSQKPIYEQIIDGIERNILLGIYPAGSLLPSVREQSVTLGINPNTIQKSYAELTRRGIISPSPGSGCFVSYDARSLLCEEARKKLPRLSELLTELRIAGIEQDEILGAVASVYTKDDLPRPDKEVSK
ncbi:MAG: GntR family transcriptional regulator [Clostridia bacterium]|nr:GntR family transcriptional regulator [Clostridia bacterium]MBR2908519.1 GntR family transcriptional regulator [Clostridia bacterium]